MTRDPITSKIEDAAIEAYRRGLRDGMDAYQRRLERAERAEQYHRALAIYHSGVVRLARHLSSPGGEA
jgi:hypothetical protein